MSIDTISVGIIGCGRAGAGFHLPALSRLPGVRIAALADIDDKKVNSAGTRFGVSARFADYRYLLDLPDLDAIAICTPTLLHVPMALDALSAHKHVFVEKPLGLSLSEISSLRQAAAATDRKITVGFVLRHHRLLRQARAAIALGLLGTVEAIQTHWAIPLQFQGSLPEWRKQRATGGGAMIDFAVHHIDLWRYLLATEIDSITTQARSVFSEDQTITLNARLTNDVLATSTISEVSTDSHEIHIFGHLGALHVSCYRFDGLSFEPIFAPASAAHQWFKQIETLMREIPYGISARGEGGEYGRAFLNEWSDFLACIRTNTTPEVTLDDGFQATTVLLAAMQSADEARPIHVATVSPSPTLPDAIKPVDLQVGAVAVRTPQLSVIMVTLDTLESLQPLLAFLLAQTVADQLELVIVAPRASWLRLDELRFTPFAGYCVVEIGSARSVAAMEAAGVKAATAPVVVFSEEHCFPAPDWAEKLIARHQDHYAAVSPAIRNANPFSPLSWADVLISYGPWLEPLSIEQAQALDDLPWHHTSYKRSILVSFGDELALLLEAANMLHDRLRQSGQTFLIDPSIVVSHVQFTRYTTWMACLFFLGRLFASRRSQSWHVPKRAFYTAASPLIPFVRLWRALRILRRDPARRAKTVAVALRLLIGLPVSAFGELVGYAFGEGDSPKRMMRYEFHRWHDTNPSDWEAFSTHQGQLN